MTVLTASWENTVLGLQKSTWGGIRVSHKQREFRMQATDQLWSPREEPDENGRWALVGLAVCEHHPLQSTNWESTRSGAEQCPGVWAGPGSLENSQQPFCPAEGKSVGNTAGRGVNLERRTAQTNSRLRGVLWELGSWRSGQSSAYVKRTVWAPAERGQGSCEQTPEELSRIAQEKERKLHRNSITTFCQNPHKEGSLCCKKPPSQDRMPV